jgi:hypothetical protein
VIRRPLSSVFLSSKTGHRFTVCAQSGDNDCLAVVLLAILVDLSVSEVSVGLFFFSAINQSTMMDFVVEAAPGVRSCYTCEGDERSLGSILAYSNTISSPLYSA